MKLSDVRGERTLDVISEIAGPVSRIAQSDGLKAIIDGAASDEPIKTLGEGVPKLISECKEDVLTVLSSIAGVSRDEYVERMTLASLIEDVMELLTDSAFSDFLGSASQSGDGPKST